MSLFGRLYGRVPRVVRRGVALLAIYQGYQYVTVSDKLYKLFSPSAHILGGTILDLNLTSVELLSSESQRSAGPLASSEQISVHRVIAALESARDDPRVAGLVVRGVTGLGKIGLAEISELRSAIKSFSEGWGGKTSILHVPEGMDLAGNGTIPLYFASAFDSAHIQPTSSVVIPGLSFGSVFLKGTLDKLGITPVKVARKEYKTAANMFTESEFTPADRESTEALLDAINNVLVDGVASGRSIPRPRVVDAINVGIMTAPDAAERGLVDKCAYRDELPDIMRSMLDKGVKKREEQRRIAESEWHAAMSNLVNEWLRNDSAELKRWNKGRRIADLGNLNVALPLIASFGDPTRGEDVRLVIDAEIRALRAHLAWIETRPWEAVPRSERPGHIAYALGNAASVVELERRLCKESINALENCQIDIAERRKETEELTLANAKKILRWTRAMWRAKALSARMVSSVLESRTVAELVTAVDQTSSSDGTTVSQTIEDVDGKTDSVQTLELESEGATDREPLHGKPYVPRLFLLHQSGDSVSSFEGSASGDDSKGFCVKHPSTGQYRNRLRYVRFTEYVENATQELRAAQRRLRALFGSTQPTLKNVPEGEHIGGLIDSAEQFALFRLANSAVVFAQPWRMHALRNSATVAVINIQGAISDEGAEDIRAHIRSAEKDPRVHAIVLRIDSPGGSASASDTIARAVEVARKPTVASMANVCASGGYFISAPCDRIFAEAATVTGSIGVIYINMRLTGLYEKLGLTVDSVERGRFAKYFGVAGTVEEWDTDFKARIEYIIDDIYNSFVSIAARGRGMPFPQLEKIARGRVWSGHDALKLGLIDHIGGLSDATKLAAEMAGAAPDATVRGVMYPSIPVLVENRLRRLGVLSSHLDEEGDERISSDSKRRRSSLRMLLLGNDEDDDDPGNDDEGDGSHYASDDSSKEQKSPSSSGPNAGRLSNRAVTVDGVFGSESDRHWDGMEAWGKFPTAVVVWGLRRLDDHLLGECPSRLIESAVDYFATLFPGVHGAGSIIKAELDAARATDGKLAAIMSPQVHVRHGEFSGSRSTN